MQQSRSGTAKQKRNIGGGIKAELCFSTKTQKHQLQRRFRNGKFVDMPHKGNQYRRVGGDAKWTMV